MLTPMEQLLAFCDFERRHNPHPKGRPHIAEWAAAEIERLNFELLALKAATHNTAGGPMPVPPPPQTPEPPYLLLEHAIIDDWHAISGLSRITGGYTAWAARQPLTATDPLNEPAGPLHYEFGRTRQEAITRLMASLPRATIDTETYLLLRDTSTTDLSTWWDRVQAGETPAALARLGWPRPNQRIDLLTVIESVIVERVRHRALTDALACRVCGGIGAGTPPCNCREAPATSTP